MSGPDGLGARAPEDGGRESAGGVGIAEGTAALGARIARGDRAALGAFYEAWFGRCYAMARSLTGRDESFCLDVVQEAMLRVVRGVRRMDSDADLARWMVRVVHSSALDLLRRERRRAGREREAARRRVEPVAKGRADGPDAAWLAGALAALDAQERAMLVLRYGRGATLERIGQAVGTTGDGAHGRIRRALARLRGMVE